MSRKKILLAVFLLGIFVFANRADSAICILTREELQVKLEKAQKLAIVLNKKVEALTRDLDALRKKKTPQDTAGGQLKQKEQDIAALKKENSALSQEIANLKKGGDKKPSQDLSKARDEISALKKENAALSKDLDALRKKKETVKGVPSDDKVKALSAEAKLLKEENESLTKKLDALRKKKEPRKDLPVDLGKAHDEIAALQKENDVLTQELAGIKKTKDKKSSLELDKTKEEIAALKKENDLLAQKLKRLPPGKGSSDGVKQNGEEIAGLKKENESLAKEIAALKKKEPSAKISEKPSNTQAEISSLKKEKASLTKELENIRKKKFSEEAIIAQLKGKIAALEKDNSIISAMMTQFSSLRLRKSGLGLTGVSPGEEDRQLHIDLGYLYAQKGKYNAAIQEYLKALEAGPCADNKDLHYNLGCLYALDGRPKQAIEAFNNALKGSDEDSDVYYNLAVIHAKDLNDKPGAVEYYKKSLSFSLVPEPIVSP